MGIGSDELLHSRNQRDHNCQTASIVIITSNAEKELPDAFYVRCIFHYIAFPDPDTMESIISVHHPKLEKKLLEQAMETFYLLRNVPDIQKSPVPAN